MLIIDILQKAHTLLERSAISLSGKAMSLTELIE